MSLKNHRKMYWIVSFMLAMNFAFCIEGTPFPQSQLSSEILSQFYPQILEELEKELSHQNDGRTHRDTREYGYSFFKMEQGDFSYTPPPAFLNELAAYVCKSLGQEPQEFTQIILSLYEEGFHLEPHVDAHSSYRYDRRFYFDENVYGLIIEPDSTGHLYFVRDDLHSIAPLGLPPVYSLEEKTGTTYCLQGSYRNIPYFHGVSKVSKRRVSITFRNVTIETEVDPTFVNLRK